MRTVEELQLGYRRLEGAQACRNIMGLLSHYISTADVDGIASLFSSRDDIRVNYGGRSFSGKNGIRNCFGLFTSPHHGAGPLTVKIYDMDTPLLEVAGDGQTAKGCWTSAGHETTPFGLDGGTGRAKWRWARYAADFILDPDGTWKIWHLLCHALFITEWNEPWSNHPWPEGPWRPDAAFPLSMPLPPEPYEHFDDTFMYV